MSVADFEAAWRMLRDLMNGRPVDWHDTEIELRWAQGRARIPLYIAGYGPKVLAIAGRLADGVIVQVAEPEIVEWILAQVQRTAEAAGPRPVRAARYVLRSSRRPRRPCRLLRTGALVPGNGLEPPLPRTFQA